MAKTKAKPSAKPIKGKKKSADEKPDAEHKAAEKVMQAVLAENKVEEETVRIDQWVAIECPHCGEGTEIHVTTEEDGQSLDQDCSVCCRGFIAHVEIDEGEAHVGVEAA